MTWKVEFEHNEADFSYSAPSLSELCGLLNLHGFRLYDFYRLQIHVDGVPKSTTSPEFQQFLKYLQ